MNKSNLTTGLSALCALLLIVLLVLQAKQKTNLETLRLEHQAFANATEQRQQESHDAVAKLADQVATLGTNLDSRLVQGEQQANEEMGATLNMIQQNTAVMHRALGKVIPVELPEALTNQLAALEARIADENSWPKDSTNADAMVAELSGLIRQIPAWAEEDYLPRLNALLWAAKSFQVLQANRNAESNALETAADAYANQLSIQPADGAANIAAVLMSQQQDAIARFATFRRESAINGAKEQVGLAVMTDGFEAWQHLAEWTNDPAVGQNALELRQQLHARLLDDEIAKYSDTTKIELGKLDTVTNSPLRQAGYLRTLENVTIQRLRLLQESDATPSTVNALTDLSTAIETRIKGESDKQRQVEAGRERGYQSWALGKIADFRSDFDNAQNQKRPRFGDSIRGPEIYTNYGMISDAIVKNLLQVSPEYLDSAVAMIYRQAFDDGMNKLDGNLQLVVAKEDAKTLKKTPQNYLEN
jgi:hypothetical protein